MRTVQGKKGQSRTFRFPWRTAHDIRNDVDDELEFHLALHAQELERRGLSPEDARREALRRFGDLETTRRVLNSAGRRTERLFRARTTADALIRDVRYALRALRRNFLFAVAATLVLGLGIGSSVAVFSLLDTLVLRPLPLRDPDRLFAIGTQPPPDAQWTMQTVRLSVLEQWQADAESVEQIDGYASLQLTWQGPDGPEMIAAGAVVGHLFAVLGVRMAAGRPFTAAEHESYPAIVSHSFWRRRLGAREDIIGAPIQLDGVQHTVVGVLPPEAGLPTFGDAPLAWIPLPPVNDAPDSVALRVIGRLRVDVERDTAQAELATIQSGVEDERGIVPKSAGIVLQSMRENRAGPVGATLAALFGGSLLLLFIACANVGTLTLTRLMERRHEFAMRVTLGASRWRVLRQIITEHVVLWAIGGMVGLSFAVVAVGYVLRAGSLAAVIPFADALPVDSRVILFACGTTLVTALVFALLPALESAHRSPIATLREDGAAVSTSHRTRAWRQGLIVAQIALSTLLASGAGLLTASLVNLTSQPLGLRSDDLLTFNVQLPQREYPDQQSRRQFQRALLATLRALPGVESAATTSALPLGTIIVGPIRIEGAESSRERQWAGIQAVDNAYFRTAEIPVVAGRAFVDSDVPGGDLVVVVNEEFARVYFGNEDPIGKRVALPGGGASSPWYRIVGIVADVKHAGLDFDYLPEIFGPYDQIAEGPASGILGGIIHAVLRVPEAFAPTPRGLRQMLSALDSNLPLLDIRTGEQLVAASARQARFRAAVMNAIAVLAVVLSGIGLYAVIAQSVAQRRKEFGIRMAIGATPTDLLRSVGRYGVVLALSGVAVGLLATFALARFVQSLLFGISAFEPVILTGVACVMFVVAAAAAVVPAFRATRLSPTLAIRNEP